jgi:hypothetical protein
MARIPRINGNLYPYFFEISTTATITPALITITSNKYKSMFPPLLFAG